VGHTARQVLLVALPPTSPRQGRVALALPRPLHTGQGLALTPSQASPRGALPPRVGSLPPVSPRMGPQGCCTSSHRRMGGRRRHTLEGRSMARPHLAAGPEHRPPVWARPTQACTARSRPLLV